MDYENARAKARQLCAESGVNVLPYGDAWWLVGQGVSRVMRDLAGLRPSDLQPFKVTVR